MIINHSLFHDQSHVNRSDASFVFQRISRGIWCAFILDASGSARKYKMRTTYRHCQPEGMRTATKIRQLTYEMA